MSVYNFYTRTDTNEVAYSQRVVFGGKTRAYDCSSILNINMHLNWVMPLNFMELVLLKISEPEPDEVRSDKSLTPQDDRRQRHKRPARLPHGGVFVLRWSCNLRLYDRICEHCWARANPHSTLILCCDGLIIDILQLHLPFLPAGTSSRVKQGK